MITRIYGFPDTNGIIRVSCGTDILEIQIVGPPGGPPAGPPGAPAGGGAVVGGSGNTPPVTAPGQPGSAPVPPVIWNPADLPGTYMRAPRDAYGDVDWDRLIEDVARQVADPTRRDPEGVVLSVGKADLHEISRIGREIDAAAPGLPLAIDFGGLNEE